MTQPDTARVTLLSDGNCMSDGGGQYGLVPRVRWTQLQTPDAQNRIIQVLRCVLIRVGGKTILVDCGCGDKALVGDYYPIERPAGTLLDDLARQGVAPEQIDIVILTHLHGDHCGWATRAVGGRYAGINTPYDPDNFAPTFPRALLCPARWSTKPRRAPMSAPATPISRRTTSPCWPRGVLTLLEGDAEIVPGVRVVSTPGHSEGHQSVILEDAVLDAPSAAGLLFYLGELATVMIQFCRLPWVTAYDVLPMTTIDTKRRWQAWAIDKGALVVTGHDPDTIAARLSRDPRGFTQATRIP
ncbi:MAG: MBL fold metallo-hydrolase [Anaerolineae bacterium]|nr:MBL fold metallo-hydrolase [Anaerolineae bacterium]